MAADGFALAQAFVRIRPDSTGFRASATSQIKQALAGVQGNVKLNVDSDLAQAKLTELRGYLASLTGRAWEMAVGVDDKAFQLKMDRIFAKLRRLDRTTSNPKITLEGIARAQTQLLALDVQLDALDAKLVETGNGFAGWATKIPLFAGAFGAAIGIIHLGVDVLFEFLAVLVPATIALTTFGVVAADTFTLLYQRFQTVQTVGRAMNQSLLPLGGTLAKMEAAAQPQVYALLGDALQIAGQKGGEFAKLARAAGAAIDQLASRATLALKSSGFSAFVKDAAPDLAKLGTVAGNIFGILGNLLKGLTPTAQILLNFFVALTHALEVLTASPIFSWVERLTLAFHGLYVYLGLIGTGLFLLGRPLGAVAGALAGVSSTADASAGILTKAKAGWQQLGNSIPLVIGPAKTAGTAIEDASVAAEDAGGKTGLLTKAFGALSGSFGWIGLAVAGAAAIGILIYSLSNAKDAVGKWADGLQNSIDASATFGSVAKNTVNSINQTNVALRGSYQNYKAVAGVTGEVATRYGVVNAQAATLSHQIDELRAAHQRYTSELQTENNRIQQLTNLFGNAQIAQGLMNQAGIKASAIATDNQKQWQQDVQTLQSLWQAIKATADAAGVAGNNEKVLTYELTDQYTAVQKLNSAWDTYVSAVTGTQTSFDTVAQGMVALTQTGGTTTNTLGKLSVTTKYLKSNIDALTPAGVALNQAFSDQVNNFNKLFDSWRQSGLATKTISEGIKAAIATLLPFAAGSKEATAQLAALASEAGYSGPVDFRLLQQWLGNITGATNILKKTTDEATFSETQLTGAFEAQGNAIAQKLIGNINAAILAYNGVYKAATAYGKAIAATGKNSDATARARQVLINDIIRAGKAADQSNAQIEAMIGKVLQIPKSAAVRLVMSAEGNYTIAGAASFGPGQKRAAAGYRVPGYGGGDRHPALLEGGETVVPKHLTPVVAPLLAAHGVPGFQSGIVNIGNQAIYGPYAGAAYQAWGTTSIVVLINSMRAALYAAEKAAIAAAQAAGQVGIRVYDSGGFLPPGVSMAYNGTGRPEPVGAAAGQEVKVQLEWVGTDQGIFSALRQGIRTRGGLKKALGP